MSIFKLLHIFNGSEPKTVYVPSSTQIFIHPPSGRFLTEETIRTRMGKEPINVTWSQEGTHFFVIEQEQPFLYLLHLYRVDEDLEEPVQIERMNFRGLMTTPPQGSLQPSWHLRCGRLNEVGCRMHGIYWILLTLRGLYISCLEETVPREIVIDGSEERILQYGINASGYFYYTVTLLLDGYIETAGRYPDRIVVGSYHEPHLVLTFTPDPGSTIRRVWLGPSHLYLVVTYHREGEEDLTVLEKRDLQGIDADQNVSLSLFHRLNLLDLVFSPNGNYALMTGLIDLDDDDEEDEDMDLVGRGWIAFDTTTLQVIQSFTLPIASRKPIRKSPPDPISTIDERGVIRLYQLQDMVRDTLHISHYYPKDLVACAQDALVEWILRKTTGKCMKMKMKMTKSYHPSEPETTS